MTPNPALHPTAKRLRWFPPRYARRRRVKATVRRFAPVERTNEVGNGLVHDGPLIIVG